MKTKGQAFMSDFAVSMALFGVLVAAFFIPWNTMIESDTRFSEAEQMQNQAERTAAFLITTPGYPNDWAKTDTVPDIPGLSNKQDNVISVRKLEAFNSIDYGEKRSLMNVQDFSLEFRDPETSKILKYDGEAEGNIYDQGLNISEDAETVVNIDRKVIVNKSAGFENAEMKYVVWR